MTNQTNVGQIVSVMRMVGTAAGCDTLIGGSVPSMKFLVSQGETLHIPFPVAVVFTPINDTVCVRVDLQTPGIYTDAVQVALNGFLGP
jgi:hypothetical protein